MKPDDYTNLQLQEDIAENGFPSTPKEFVELLDVHYGIEKILDEIEVEVIVSYMKGDIIDCLKDDRGYFIFENLTQLQEFVDDEPDIASYPPGGGMYKSDCITLIEEIVQRDGWNYLYSLIESEKIL